MTAPPLTAEEQAVRLTDTAGKRRLTPAEHARLRECVSELAARASGPSGGTGPRTRLDAPVGDEQAPHAPVARTRPRQPHSRTHSPDSRGDPVTADQTPAPTLCHCGIGTQAECDTGPAGCGPTSTDPNERYAQSGVDTPDCTCGHQGMGAGWHLTPCPHSRRGAPGQPAGLARLRQQYADVEARRAAMPEQDRLRHEAGDAPMLRIQLLHVAERAQRADAEVSRLTGLVGEYADRAIANGQCAERAEHSLGRVRGECAAIVAERYGQHDEDDDGMREAVRRVLAALDDQPTTEETA